MDDRFYSNAPLEVRHTNAGGISEIIGYAAVYYRSGDKSTEFSPVEGVVERVMPGAFDSSLSSSQDIIATYDHDSARVLGRTSNGTLQLRSTGKGLEFRIPYQPGDPDHDLVTGKIARGLVTGASFAFTIPAGGDKIVHTRSETVRELHNVNLVELGPVSMPAYYGSDAAVRDASGWKVRRNAVTRIREIKHQLRGMEDV